MAGNVDERSVGTSKAPSATGKTIGKTGTTFYRSEAGGTTAGSPSVQQTSAAGNKEENQEEEDENATASPQKRNPDTDAKNPEFVDYITIRKEQRPRSVMRINKEKVSDMCSGRPLKRRLDVPEGVEVNQYSGQKNNIWEMQNRQMRQAVLEDKSNYYTYSKDHLSLAFP